MTLKFTLRSTLKRASSRRVLNENRACLAPPRMSAVACRLSEAVILVSTLLRHFIAANGTRLTAPLLDLRRLGWRCAVHTNRGVQ